MGASRLEEWQVLAREAEELGLLRPGEGDAAGSTPALRALLHERRDPAGGKRDVGAAALCLSGGGIRSATFNLGVLQGLARSRLLGQFHYLSTVSGGGYIGAWLSALIYRHEGDVEVVRRLLARDTVAGPDGAPDPITHLRRFSKYLSPRLGVLSADTWALVSIYGRNLILNWLVLVPLLMAVLMAPRLVVILEQALVTHGDALVAGISWRRALALLGVALVAWSFAYAARNQPSITDVDPTSPGRGKPASATPARVMGFCLVPLLLGAVATTLAWTWRACAPGEPPPPPPDLADLRAFNLFGVVLGVIGGGIGWFSHSNERRAVLELGIVVVAGCAAASVLWGEAVAFSYVAAWLTGSPCPDVWWHLLYVTFGVPAVLLALSAGGTLFLGLCSRQSWATDGDREWWARFGGWILIASWLWLGACALVILAPAGLLWLGAKAGTVVGTTGGLAGIATALLGMSADTPGTAEAAESRRGSRWKALTLKLVGPLFLVLFLCALALLTDALLRVTGAAAGADHAALLLASSPWTLVVLAALALLGVLLAWLFHLNRFSLHAIYRDRLIRAYLGASNPERRPNGFTGFDPNDNVWMHLMRPALRAWMAPAAHQQFVDGLQQATNEDATQMKQALPKKLRSALGLEGEVQPAPPTRADGKRLKCDMVAELARHGLYREENIASALGNKDAVAADARPLRLLHVVNMTLNLARADNTAWQERKADSCTATMFHTGNARLGYRDSARYAGADGITLGTAVSISGAAVSPNMGYQSSPLMAFLLTLLNVRLGAWFGNPGPAGDTTHEHDSPRFGLLTLVREALGNTTDRHKYVYLSDGGHFENLGLYEMVRRRCGFIVVCDAGQDPKCGFEDLGNAIRKIRVDFGIPITFDPLRIRARDDQAAGGASHHALGTIDYAAADGPGAPPGTVLYLKASLTGDEPMDIRDFAARTKAFPHESTGDQFFSEAQFESYRALGEHIVQGLTPKPSATLADWVAALAAKESTPS